MPDQNNETFNTWNEIASLYQEKFMDLDLYNHTYDHICNTIEKPNARLLEIGCGPGNITKYLLSKRPDFEILGIDVAPNMIRLAEQNNPGARFMEMDCRNLKSLGQSYDGIIAGFCLPYLSLAETEQLITDAYEMLNADGLLYLSFVDGDPQQSTFKSGGGGRVYFYYHQLEDLRALLQKTNFGILETFRIRYSKQGTIDDFHTVLTAIK